MFSVEFPWARRLLEFAILTLLILVLMAFSGCGSSRPKGPDAPSRSAKKPASKNYVAFRNGGELSWPVGYGRLASTFGPRNDTFHDGLDIASEEGLPVRASHSGKVVYSGNRLGGYGNLIILKHQSGLITVYAHNEKLYAHVGDKVYRGAVIATLGQTGHATGPHVHFEVRVKDRRGRYVAVDPLPLLGPAGGKPRFRVNESLTAIVAGLFP